MHRHLATIAHLGLIVVVSLWALGVKAEDLRVTNTPERHAADQGLYIGSSLELALLEQDLFFVTRPALGYLSPQFDLILQLPVEWRLLDLAPQDPDPLLFGVLRRGSYIPAGKSLNPTALTQIVRDLRIGQAGDLFYLRAGALSHSLGHGSTVWRFASSPDPDRRHAGVAVQVGNDFIGLEGVVGDVLAPQEISAARAYLRPLLALDFANGMLSWLRPRLALGGGYAADFFAPYDSKPQGAKTSVVQLLSDLEMLWLDDPRLRLLSYLDVALRRSYGDQWGQGEELGLLSQVNLWGSELSLRLGLRWAGSGYRPSEFDAFYYIERETSFADGNPLAQRPCPAGLGGVVDAALSLSEILTLRLQLDSAPGENNNKALLGAELHWGPVQAGVALAQRAFDQPIDLLSFGPRTVVLAETRWAVYGPVALVGRYWRTLRRHDQALGLDNDVMLGVEVAWLLK